MAAKKVQCESLGESSIWGLNLFFQKYTNFTIFRRFSAFYRFLDVFAILRVFHTVFHSSSPRAHETPPSQTPGKQQIFSKKSSNPETSPSSPETLPTTLSRISTTLFAVLCSAKILAMLKKKDWFFQTSSLPNSKMLTTYWSRLPCTISTFQLVWNCGWTTSRELDWRFSTKTVVLLERWDMLEDMSSWALEDYHLGHQWIMSAFIWNSFWTV